MVTNAAQDPQGKEVFAAGKLPPKSEYKPLDIDDVLKLLQGERKQNRLLTQHLYELTAALDEAAQFCGDLVTGDVDMPGSRATEVGLVIEAALAKVGR